MHDSCLFSAVKDFVLVLTRVTVVTWRLLLMTQSSSTAQMFDSNHATVYQAQMTKSIFLLVIREKQLRSKADLRCYFAVSIHTSASQPWSDFHTIWCRVRLWSSCVIFGNDSKTQRNVFSKLEQNNHTFFLKPYVLLIGLRRSTKILYSRKSTVPLNKSVVLCYTPILNFEKCVVRWGNVDLYIISASM